MPDPVTARIQIPTMETTKTSMPPQPHGFTEAVAVLRRELLSGASLDEATEAAICCALVQCVVNPEEEETVRDAGAFAGCSSRS